MTKPDLAAQLGLLPPAKGEGNKPGTAPEAKAPAGEKAAPMAAKPAKTAAT